MMAVFNELRSPEANENDIGGRPESQPAGSQPTATICCAESAAIFRLENLGGGWYGVKQKAVEVLQQPAVLSFLSCQVQRLRRNLPASAEICGLSKTLQKATSARHFQDGRRDEKQLVPSGFPFEIVFR